MRGVNDNGRPRYNCQAATAWLLGRPGKKRRKNRKRRKGRRCQQSQWCTGDNHNPGQQARDQARLADIKARLAEVKP